MLTEEQKIMRYAGGMACAYDYAMYGAMERTIEKMSKEDCLASIRKLYALKSGDIPIYDEAMKTRVTHASNIWAFKQQVGGYNNNEIAGVEDWNLEEVYKAYGKQRTAIETSLILGSLTRATGESIGVIAQKVGIKKWTLFHWICFQEEISPKFQESIKALEEEGKPYTVYDLFDYVSRVYGTKNKIIRQGAQEGENA